jgi:hypothetical protein
MASKTAFATAAATPASAPNSPIPFAPNRTGIGIKFVDKGDINLRVDNAIDFQGDAGTRNKW